MRLDKYAAHAAKSRRDIKKMINDGRVSVNGIVVKDAGFNVNMGDEVLVDGKLFRYREFIYLIMNKPKDVVSATYDPKKKTVIDLLSEEDKRFEPFPVGRLDIDTTGLLLLTNDGKAAHNLLSPSKKVPKKYVALLDAPVESGDIVKFKEGIVLDDGYKTKPAILTPLEGYEAEVIISEGKFHQVKRMFADVGKKVLELKRVEFAGILLDTQLSEGEYRHILTEEMKILSKIMQ